MAASPTASASGSVAAAAAAAASEANDGPVLSVVSKHLRALRKKQNHIAQMEESAAAGKALNQEQKEVLRSKPIVAALIDELERLRSPLSAALTEELSTVPAPAPAPAAAPADSSVQDLLALVYFGSLFDVKPQSEFLATMVAREHERSSCISYDYVGDDTVDLLVENDLNTVSALATLAAARPASAVGVSHRDALQACANHARLWLARADEPIGPDTPATYAAVRAKLEKIMASEYYTAAAIGGVQPQESSSASPEAPSVEENLAAAEGHKVLSGRCRNWMEDGEFPLEGQDIIKDPKVRAPGSKLHLGTCSMEGCSLDIRIRKAPEIKKAVYDLMNSMKHNSLIPHLNFYSESNHGRLVIPVIETSFVNWMKEHGKKLLFHQNGNMTTLFKTIILDICDAVEKLWKSDILIKNLDLNNLYMANEISPRVLILVTEAEASGRLVSKPAIWGPVQKILESCYEACSVTQSESAKRYIHFIGQSRFTVKALQTYPEDWDPYTKGEYLHALIAANQRDIRAGIKVTGLSWPREHGQLPQLITAIITEECNKGRNYDTNSPFDYIMLIRNIYKHFKYLPYHIKAAFGNSKEGFLNQLERWTPTIWQDLYDAIGWP